MKNKSKISDVKKFSQLIVKYLRPYWKAMCVLITINLIITFLSAVVPATLAPILDIALNKGTISKTTTTVSISHVSLKNLGAYVYTAFGMENHKSKIYPLAFFSGIYLGLIILTSILNFGVYLLALWIRVRGARQMQLDLYSHILLLSMGFFTKQKTGELMSRLDTDTNAATSGIEDIVSALLTAPFLIVIYGILLLRTSPVLVYAAMLAFVLHFLLSKGIEKPIRKRSRDEFSIFANLRGTLQETLVGIRVVKSFNAELYEIKKLLAAINEIVRINMKKGVFKHIEEPIRTIINGVVEIILILVAAYEVINGHLSASAFFMFCYVGRLIVSPIAKLSGTFVSIQATLAAADRVFELFSIQPKVVDGAQTLYGFKDSIRITNVSFAYESNPVLRNIDLDIRKGDIMALVGPSGSGKSTLADLLIRFYDPVSGEILIDGINIKAYSQQSYRNLFGVVPQEPILFNTSIFENIQYGRTTLGEEYISNAARIANAHDFIMELPQGYKTLIGDRGIRLSGGQRQRIAIARAVVNKPEILLLDEATSSLDTDSEKQVQTAIDNVLKNCTAVIIAHRLSTILHANKIAVIQNGIIDAIGNHNELLVKSPTYKHLYELQFSDGSKTKK